MSPGLYYQMTGRGFRLHPDKKNCLILDFGGNIMRHGPVDAITIKEPGKGSGEAPAKKCPECNSVIHAAYQTCPDCGHEFPLPERNKHDSHAATKGIISGQVDYTSYDVKNVFYSVHVKRDAEPDDPRTMRIEYCVNFNHYISEWVCPEHTGYARAKFEAWWLKRSKAPFPDTAYDAVNLANDGALAKPLKVIVKSIAGEKYDRVVDYELEPAPDYILEPGWNDSYDELRYAASYGSGEDDYDDSEIPF
jgi:DNA repair protein RadD